MFYFSINKCISNVPRFFTSKFSGFTIILRQVYILVRPYGRRRLVKVFTVSLLQALSQVVSVATVFPFLSLVAEPGKFSDSYAGQWFGAQFPTMNHDQLLLVTGIAVIATLFVANGFSLYGEFYRARFTWGFAHWLRMRMLHQMNSKSYAWYLQQNSSILIKKTTRDVMQFVNGILGPIVDGTSRLLITVLLLSTILIVETKIALSIALILGAMYLFIFVLLNKFRTNLSASLKVHWRGVFHHFLRNQTHQGKWCRS